VVADGGQVHVAVGVDLARDHHHVSFTVPHDVEDGAEGNPRLYLLGYRRADGPGAADQGCLAVGEQQVRGEGVPGQARPDRRNGAEGADQNLAVVPEGLCAGDGAHLGAGYFGHAVVS